MEDISSQQHVWLQQLQSLSKRPIRVSRNIQGRPSAWGFMEDIQFPVDYRTVLHNEVVIDIDSTRWKEVRLFTEMTIDVLNRMHVPFIPAYTGGRGVHIHFFFSLTQNQKQKCDKYDVMPQDLRMFLFEKIMKETGISSKVIGPGKPFDTSCINWSDGGKGHLIRIFGGKKQRYKTVLQEIPEEKPHIKDITFPEKNIQWNISDDLFEEFLESFKISHKKRVEATARYRAAGQNFTGTYLKLPCIQGIMRGLPEGQRNKGAQILSLVCRLDDIPKDNTQKILLEYAQNCSSENISEKEYLSWVDWIYSQQDVFWNCRFCKELELCTNDCSFQKAAYKDVNEFLTDPNLIQRIDTILEKNIKKDKQNRMIIFFVCLSAYGSNPLNIFLKGESSIGKTHLAETVAGYFPEEDVLFIGDMSPKALIHEKGEFEKGRVYVSLENKILVFLETPRKETLDMLKPILSHDRKEIEYKITDKTGSGKLGTKSVIITGWPATIFCTTDHRYLEELSTRSMVTTPEISDDKIAQVLEYKGEQYVKPWETKTVDAEEVTLKEALHHLKSTVEITLPYSKELAREYYEENGSQPRAMRDFDKLMGLIEMSAFLHQKQRLSFSVPVNGDIQDYCMGNEDDLLLGMALFEFIRETTVTGLPQPVLDFYTQMVVPIEEEVTYPSMIAAYEQIYKRTVSQVHLKRKFVDPLMSTGYLLQERHPTDGRKWIFEKMVFPDEINKDTNIYRSLVLEDMYPENELKEYVNEIKKIVPTNEENNKGIFKVLDERKKWFYTSGKNVYYFLEHLNEPNGNLKYNDDVKKQHRLNVGNSDKTNHKYALEENELINQYDEETVLLQIPQEDTRIEDVVKKFKDPNKVVDTFVILQEKAKIIAGQGFIRRIKST